jgi:hypothetical protein
MQFGESPKPMTITLNEGRKTMTLKTGYFAAAILLGASVLTAGSALAQGGPPPGGPGPGGFGRMGGPEDEMRFIGIEAGAGEKKVTGAPFSASFTATTTQTLADGNKISRSSNGTIARDNDGRVRRETTLPAGPWSNTSNATTRVVFISDPVAGVNYVLRPDAKTAEKFTPPTDGRRPHDGNKPRHDNNDETTISLGTQTIGGVQAEGTRITRTIPAGAIGNQNPIQIVIEKWYAPSLQMDVMSKRSDPRYGETTYQLASVQTSTPAAAQFQVPSDYAVTAGRPRGPRGGGQPPTPPQQ